MRIRGDFQIVENLYFHHCAPAPGGDVSFEQIWSVGALHVSLGNVHVNIRNNEFANNQKAIQSYSQYSLITQNYMHDVNGSHSDGWLSKPYWEPIGIQLGIGDQEVSFNTIENMYVVSGEWGGDGGAIEIDDGRNHKDNIHIHHNTTYHNMGFLEISYWDVADGEVNFGLSFGSGKIEADPLFVDWEGGDYHLQPNSPAAGWGAQND
jgi:hypothetical protein